MTDSLESFYEHTEDAISWSIPAKTPSNNFKYISQAGKSKVAAMNETVSSSELARSQIPDARTAVITLLHYFEFWSRISSSIQSHNPISHRYVDILYWTGVDKRIDLEIWTMDGMSLQIAVMCSDATGIRQRISKWNDTFLLCTGEGLVARVHRWRSDTYSYPVDIQLITFGISNCR